MSLARPSLLAPRALLGLSLTLTLTLTLGCGGDGKPRAPTTFAVGVTTRMWSDASRPTPANGTAAASSARKLPTEIWYPALAEGTADEYRDAALDRRAAPYPLVLFVHGSSGFRRQSTFLLRALAAAGYVVAAADFPLTSFFTDGGPSDRHVDDQLGDLRFLADSMAALSATAGEPLAGSIRPSDGYALAGHSTGGTVALAAAFSPDRFDPRLRTSVALAPCACFFRESFFATRALPLFVLAGTSDRLVPFATNARYAYDHAGPPKRLALLAGGTHLFFTDFSLADDPASTPTTRESDLAQSFAAYGGGTVCDPSTVHPTDAPMSDADQRRLTIALVRAHLDSAMKAGPGSAVGAVAATDPRIRYEER